jgi:hypothetical protein
MMQEQWDPATPSIYMFSKVKDGVDTAYAVNAPYMVNQVLTMAFNHVIHTGTMQNVCEHWNSLVQMNKTRSRFQTMFYPAHETCESLTAQSGGYHGANLAQAGNYNGIHNTQSESFYTKTADAFANLVMSATVDKDLLTTLTSNNVALTGQLAANDRVIVTLQAQLRNTNGNTDLPIAQSNY